MFNSLRRYAFAVCVITYMGAIVSLHLLGFFPRPGLYDVSRLIGASQVTLEGRVVDSPIIRWNQTRFLIKGSARPLHAFRGQTVVTLAFPAYDLAPGDKVRVRGWLSSPRAASATRDFDEQGYWATRCVFSMLKVWSSESFVVLKKSSPWSLSRSAWTFHQRYRDFWERVLPWDDANLLLGITVGARGVLPKEIKEACIRAGVYHIVVVSGQNMSLIVGLGVSLLLVLKVQKRYAIWICLLPIVFYTAAVGGDPPVTRAAVMAIVGLLTAALARDIPRYYPLLLAAGWILIREPEALLGASFQLSFGATLSILAILPYWDEMPHPGLVPSLSHRERAPKGRVRRHWQRWIKQAGIMGLCVHLGIWPLLVYYFHRLSLAGFLANWTIFPLSGVLMVLGLLIGSWGVYAVKTVPGFLIQMVRWLVHRTLRIIFWMSSWSWAVRPLQPLPVWAFLLYYGFLFGILFLFHRRKIYGQIHPSFKAGRARL